MQANTNDVYSSTINAVRAAVSATENTRGKWVRAGEATLALYPTREGLDAVKAQFCVDAIVPSIAQKHRDALSRNLPRKGSKEYNELNEAGKAQWEKQMQEKTSARAVVTTYYARVCQYAYPKPEGGGAAGSKTRDLKDRIIEECAKLVKACKGAEAPTFKVADVIKSLEAAITAASK